MILEMKHPHILSISCVCSDLPIPNLPQAQAPQGRARMVSATVRPKPMEWTSTSLPKVKDEQLHLLSLGFGPSRLETEVILNSNSLQVRALVWMLCSAYRFCHPTLSHGLKMPLVNLLSGAMRDPDCIFLGSQAIQDYTPPPELQNSHAHQPPIT